MGVRLIFDARTKGPTISGTVVSMLLHLVTPLLASTGERLGLNATGGAHDVFVSGQMVDAPLQVDPKNLGSFAPSHRQKTKTR